MRQVTPPNLGAIFRPQFPPEALSEALVAAEDTSLSQLWLWEDCFLEGGLTTATAALSRTSQVTVGVGLMPVPLRNVAIAAMEIATIERLYPGRLRLAVGHGVQDWMYQVGARVESPLTLMREYLDALRELLSGVRVSCEGRYVTLRDVALDWPPSSRPHIFMGAVGPKSLALCGEFADGVVLTEDATPEVVADSVGKCLDARRAAGVTEPFEVVVYLRAYTGPDARERLQTEERSHAVGAGIAGDVEAIATRVRELAAVGAGTVCLLPSAASTSAAEYLTQVAAPVQRLLLQG